MSKNSKVAQKKTISNACCVYDFTLFDEISTTDVRNELKKHCKKYCFQKEKGDKTGVIHYQGRFSLKIKKRLNEAIKLLDWDKFHLSVTSNENKGNSFYVMKDETRLEGPFTDENDVYIPKDIKNIKELKPWQATLRNMLKEYNERTVDVVYEEKGNIGKTTLTRYMMLYDDAEMLPFCNDYKDIMRMAFDVGEKKIYLIDMPRAINKEKLFHFFSGIETLKSGYCYDDRYKFTRRLFDRPRICVFTNVKPDQSLLSKDMWKIWSVKDGQLVPFRDDSDESIWSDLEESVKAADADTSPESDVEENKKVVETTDFNLTDVKPSSKHGGNNDFF